MVYALLGVSGDIKTALRPDYDEPLPDLFFDAVQIIKSKPVETSAIKALRVLAESFECTTDPSVKAFLSKLEVTY